MFWAGFFAAIGCYLVGALVVGVLTFISGGEPKFKRNLWAAAYIGLGWPGLIVFLFPED